MGCTAFVDSAMIASSPDLIFTLPLAGLAPTFRTRKKGN